MMYSETEWDEQDCIWETRSPSRLEVKCSLVHMSEHECVCIRCPGVGWWEVGGVVLSDRALMPSSPEWQACNEVPVIYLPRDLAEMGDDPNISTSHQATRKIMPVSLVVKQEHGLSSYPPVESPW